MFKRKVENKDRKLKCLLCGEFFLKTEEQLNLALNEFKNENSHPNDLKHKIVCPKCGNDKIQIIIDNTTITKNKFQNIKENYNSISSFIGSFLGNIVGLFLTLWDENQFILFKNIFKFLGFVVAIYCLVHFLNIPPIYSGGGMLVYFFLNKNN